MTTNGSDPSKDKEDEVDEFVEVISKVLSHAINEPGILQRVEQYLSPQPAHLYRDDTDAKELTHHIQKCLNKLGRVDRLIITQEGKPPPTQVRVRTYHIDIANELARSFYVCRRAICRLHMFYITVENIQAHPEFWPDLTEEDGRIYTASLSGHFWDALEIATIRLASYWDRVGQLLDFIFFNIRQYERDGFPAVLERIKKNFAPNFSEIVRDPNWKLLLDYANSEKPAGFKWLVRRRNLAVHSTSFRPHEDKRDALFEYEFNHYEARVIRDLALKSPKEELEIIHAHLAKAAELFKGIFDFARLGIDLIEQDINSRGRL